MGPTTANIAAKQTPNETKMNVEATAPDNQTPANSTPKKRKNYKKKPKKRVVDQPDSQQSDTQPTRVGTKQLPQETQKNTAEKTTTKSSTPGKDRREKTEAPRFTKPWRRQNEDLPQSEAPKPASDPVVHDGMAGKETAQTVDAAAKKEPESNATQTNGKQKEFPNSRNQPKPTSKATKANELAQNDANQNFATLAKNEMDSNAVEVRGRQREPRHNTNSRSWQSQKNGLRRKEIQKTATSTSDGKRIDATNVIQRDDLTLSPTARSEAVNTTAQQPSGIDLEIDVVQKSSGARDTILQSGLRREDVAHGQTFKGLVSIIMGSLIQSHLDKENEKADHENRQIRKAIGATYKLVKHLTKLGFNDAPLPQSFDSRSWLQAAEPDWISNINYTDIYQIRRLRAVLYLFLEMLSTARRGTGHASIGEEVRSQTAGETIVQPKAGSTTLAGPVEIQKEISSTATELAKTPFLAVMELLQNGSKKVPLNDVVSSAPFKETGDSSSLTHSLAHESQQLAPDAHAVSISMDKLSYQDPEVEYTTALYDMPQTEGIVSPNNYASYTAPQTLLQRENAGFKVNAPPFHPSSLPLQTSNPNSGNVQDCRMETTTPTDMPRKVAAPYSTHPKSYPELGLPVSPANPETFRLSGNQNSSSSFTGSPYNGRENRRYNQAVAGVYSIRQNHSSLPYQNDSVIRSGWRIPVDDIQDRFHRSQLHPSTTHQQGLPQGQIDSSVSQATSSASLKAQLKVILENFNLAQQNDDTRLKLQHLTEVQSILTRAIKDQQASIDPSSVAAASHPSRNWDFDDSQTPEELFTRIDFSNVGDLKHMRTSVCNAIAEYRTYMVKMGFVRPPPRRPPWISYEGYEG